jgi:hypothetical protein
MINGHAIETENGIETPNILLHQPLEEYSVRPYASHRIHYRKSHHHVKHELILTPNKWSAI